MFKWKGEKKIKVLYGMQFQATQVPQLKAKALMISLVPADVGKPTVRIGKAAIKEGNCTWENPVYETVKLVREAKTGRVKEKIYYLIVSSGSSKKGFLGETYIDFAEFVETTGPLMLSLPLQASNSGAILHVTVQRMDTNPDPSDGGDEQAVDESNGGSLEMEAQHCDRDGNINLISAEDEDVDRMLNWYAQGYNKDKGPPLDHENSAPDLATLGPYFMPQKAAFEMETPERHPLSRSLTDLSSESASDGSVMEIAKGFQENYRKGTVQEASYNTNDRLENRIKVLERQVENSELEIQSLRKQIVKDSKREHELSKQVYSLEEERDALRTKYEQLKLSPKFIHYAESSNDSALDAENLRRQLEDVKKELQHEQHSNEAYGLRLQETEDSNSEFILAVRDLNQKLNQKDKELIQLSSKLHKQKKATLALEKTYEDKSHGNNTAEETANLKEKIKYLYSEIEVYQKEKEELRIQVEQLSVDYEILKRENEDVCSNLEKNRIEKNNIQQKYSESLSTVKQLKFEAERLEEGIKTWAIRYSESLETIKELETQITSLEKELDQQARKFEDDLEMVTQAKMEQENRAVKAEETLRKTKLDNANGVEHLQEELRRISVEMASKIDENVKIATEAAAEANELCLKNQVLEEWLQKNKDELSSMKEQYERKIANVRKEAEPLLEQLVTMKALLDEKKTTQDNLRSEMGEFRVQYEELKHHSLKLESENENLRMQVSRLQINLQRNKEENMPSKQGKTQNIRNSTGMIKRNMIDTEQLEKSTENHKLLKALTTNRRSMGGKGTGERKNPEEVSTTDDGMPAQNGCETGDLSDDIQLPGVAKMINSQTSNTQSISKLLSEVEELKERNKHMEDELKEIQERYSDISLKFAEVEGERQQLVMILRNLKNAKQH